MTVLDNLKSQEFIFKIQRFATEAAFTQGLAISADRFHIKVAEDAMFFRVIALLKIATQEEEVADYPANWWEALKERIFPKWLLKRYPVKYSRVWAIHKFPELNIPENVLGREFVHLKVVEWDELEKLGRKE